MHFTGLVWVNLSKQKRKITKLVYFFIFFETIRIMMQTITYTASDTCDYKEQIQRRHGKDTYKNS